MDCFYAAIEMRDDPSLRGQPVAVGGQPGRRGVLCTCNYEARKYGLHSAMPSGVAVRQCPNLQLLPVNMFKYREASEQIGDIFAEYTDAIEWISLDEAYLDVTESDKCNGSATWMAEEIRAAIWSRLTLTASAGIAPNKMLAKIASDLNKPNGQFVVLPEEIADFIVNLPVKKIMGVGKVTNKKLEAMGVVTCGDLQAWDLPALQESFGKMGGRLHRCCRGEDESAVRSERVRKSVSVEITYPKSLMSVSACVNEMPHLKERLLKRMNPVDQSIAKQFIKLTFDDFSKTSVEALSTLLSDDLYAQLLKIGFKRSDKPVRLVGIGVRLAIDTAEDNGQMALLGE